jgi:hypothetical protein
MPNQISNRTGKVLSTTLAPRSRRSSSGNIQTLWAGAALPPLATGGSSSSITVSGQAYTLLTFTSNGTLTIVNGGDFEYMAFGGGGNGGAGV